MEIETVFEGVHPGGMKFRVRRIDNMYYYAEQVPDDYNGGWVWRTVMRSPSKPNIIKRVQSDRVANQQLIEYLKERGLI